MTEPFRPPTPTLSAAVLAAIRRKALDVPYAGESASQTLDIYWPNQGTGPFPTVVYLHGGAFRFGDKRDFSLEPILTALDRGYVVVSAEYRKSGEARFPAMVYDGKAVLRFLRARAGEWDLDPRRFAAWGPSSGGWLVSMLGLTAGNPAFEDPGQGSAGLSSEVQAVVDWCGPCGGFLEMDRAFRHSGLGPADHDNADSPESLFLGAQITGLPELCRMACPMTYVSPAAPPFLILHGGADPVVPVEQSQALANALSAAAGPDRVRLHIAEGMGHHGDPWYGEPWVMKLCLDFLDEVLK